MRRPTEPEAHRARVSVIEGKYPEGMKARCAWCGKVREVATGAFVEVKRHAHGPSRAFRCGNCADGRAA
ncbi:MAG TPA: hypothetical protein VM784_11435 [Actinomycetota bacterium]|nr:hypothetical protein [Actinomycetota bacterium]